MPRASKTAAALGAAVTGLALLLLALGLRAPEPDLAPAPPEPTVEPTVELPETSAAAPDLLYGRVSTTDGATFQGRLRWGGDEEASWGDVFQGTKADSPWAALVPEDDLAERRTISLFGVPVASLGRRGDLERPFLARFGDIARIEAPGPRALRVTLKSGTAFDLERLEADDLADGLRVWDEAQGVVDLEERAIRGVELAPAPGPALDDAPRRLFGTVRTPRGELRGFLRWDGGQALAGDELRGFDALADVHVDGEPMALRFEDIKSVARERSIDGVRVSVRGEPARLLSGTRDTGDGHRGVTVDDPRYGRVLVPWPAFERVDLEPAVEGPAYGDFPPGQPLHGTVTTRAGRALGGRIVFDLDESETTETLDAPSGGLHYTIPFGLVAGIDVPELEPGPASPSAAPDATDDIAEAPVGVRLHTGETLQLERAGDLGQGNAGLLVFAEGDDAPAYVAWAEVARIELARPRATYPPLDSPRDP